MTRRPAWLLLRLPDWRPLQTSDCTGECGVQTNQNPTQSCVSGFSRDPQTLKISTDPEDFHLEKRQHLAPRVIRGDAGDEPQRYAEMLQMKGARPIRR